MSSLFSGWGSSLSEREHGQREGIAFAMAALGLKELVITDNHLNTFHGKRLTVEHEPGQGRRRFMFHDDVEIDGQALVDREHRLPGPMRNVSPGSGR